MSRQVHLNGGPMHDQYVSIEDKRDHIHIVQPLDPFKEVDLGTAPDPSEVIKTRRGMYSEVHGSKHDGLIEFEWDGWREHD